MKLTNFFKLKKPDGSDFYDVENFNYNADVIDEELEKVNSAIGQIANDRGYLTTKRFTEASDLNNLLLNGFYESNLFLNTPYGLGGWFNVHVKNLNGGYCHQILTGMEGVAIGRVFERNRNNNVWSPWKEIATTDKVITISPWETPQKIDANNIRTTCIIVTSSYCTNVPGIMGGYASTEGFLYTRKFNDAYIAQEFRSIYNNEPKWTRFLFFNNWTTWTTGSGGKQELEIPYNTGYLNNTTSRYNSKLVKNGLDQVIVYGAVKKADGSNFTAGLDTQIAIIPVGWKNSFNNRCGAVATELNGIPLGEARVAIFDGTIYVSASVSCPCIIFTIPYELLRY